MCMKRMLFLLCFVYVMCGKTLYAQHNTYAYELETKLHYGTILPHYSFLNYLVEEPQKSIEIQLRKASDYTTISSSLFRFPSYGIGYTHTFLGNSEKLGSASLLFAVLDIPIINTARWALLYQCNFGAAYIYKPLSKSIFNIAMSSPFNFFVGLDLQVAYRFTHNQTCKLGVEMSHISNGKIHTPNLGLNSLTFSAAYQYSFTPMCKERVYYNRRTLAAPMLYSAFVSGGVKTDEYLNSTLFPTSSFVFEIQKLIWYTYGFTIGVDMFYDASKALHTNKQTAFSAGIHTGVEVYYMPFSFLMHIGMYTFHAHAEHQFFNRIALRYHAKQSYCIQLGLKAHVTTADFLEIGVGYTFPNIRNNNNEAKK